jgi:lipopolysaccharide export system protein LptA
MIKKTSYGRAAGVAGFFAPRRALASARLAAASMAAGYRRTGQFKHSPVSLAALALLALAQPAGAQGFDMSRGGDTQIQVYADNGIEWHSDALRVIARGNAKAIRGGMTIDSDMLTAYYRKGPSGDEIWRLDADGAVKIYSANETATGVKGTYDLDKAIFVLRGQPARLVTATETFQASETLEYWETQRMAVLRGNALATQEDKKLQADTITAHFKDKGAAPGSAKPAAAKPAAAKGSPAGGGSLELQRADAYGNVVLTTAQEVITGDRGDYNVETGIATVSGSVKITREGNELNGGYAQVNLNTGISKLFGTTPGGAEGAGRVQGVFTPEKKGSDKRRAGFTGNAPAPGGGSPASGDEPAGR